VAILGAFAAWAGQGSAAEKPTAKSTVAAEVKPKSAPAKGAVANNSRCLVCHINFEDEELAVTHAKADIGCVKCHGESKAHSADEDNVTPPDIMFPRPKLNAACLKCHPAAKLSQVHKPVLSGAETKNKHCTDCHGEHLMSHRTRNWDKATGKLLPKPTGPPAKDASEKPK
jgi:hypothetical protein